jgi:DNA polymerase I-like protein with 3'-5' exonuclease and polymerase domains|tara:strand:- start:5681 stop:7585 length:1905 start_codon:yes stop_codon:yes gene_type:complete
MTTKMQFPMFKPESEWTPPSELPDLTGAKEIAIDLETRDPNLKERGAGWPTKNGEIIGYAVATADWSGYLPIAHAGGGNLDKRIVNNWMTELLACPADKIAHNASYDLGWLRSAGFEVNGRIIDTMLTGSLLDENRFSYSLNALGYDYLGQTKSEKGLVEASAAFGIDAKSEMHLMPAIYVGEYATKDATLCLDLWHHFKGLLGKEDLWEVWDMEMALLPNLVEMTLRGIRVDVDQAEKTKQSIIKREKALNRRIKDLAGCPVEIWAADSIAKAFDKAGMVYPQTATGRPSFTKSFLSEHPSELAKAIVGSRNLNKMNTTFIDSILKYVKNGRVHGHINQLRGPDGGTVSGRISMNNPALQTIPSRDPELGPMMRRLFLPEEFKHWSAIDFSQQEPRVLVHYADAYGKSRNTPLQGVEEFVDGYNNDPNMDFHSLVAEMTELPRKTAKVINLALMYGMGVNKLSAQLDIPVDDAKELVKQYNERVPFVKQLMQGVSQHLESNRSNGAISSLKGRKCRFDKWEPASFGTHKAMSRDEAIAAHGTTTRLRRAGTYKSLNRLIQSSSADMTKQAMVDCCKAGYLPMLQVHDELAFSVEDAEEAKKIRKIMEDALPLCVPNKCDIDLGPNWGDAVEIE